MNSKLNNKFQSHDIQLCAFLLTFKEIQLLDIQAENARQFIFILSNPDKCTELQREYLNGATAVARELFAQRQMLVSQLKERNRF